MIKISFLFLVLASWCSAATKYFDSSLGTGANDGSSWVNAWRTLAAISPSAGDTVEMSGGASGGSQTVTTSTWWAPPGGTAGNLITYRIGQDASHNGTLIFSLTGTATSWVTGTSYVILSGDAGNGQCHFRLGGNYGTISDNSSNIRISYLDASQLAALGQSFTINTHPWEVDHCLITVTDLTTGTSAFALGTSGSGGFEQSLFHHNTILVPYRSGGFGVDAFAGGGGCSVYQNTIQGYFNAGYSAGQHCDGWQITGGSSTTYDKYYNNTIIDIPNYGFYGDALTSTGFSHLWVYNNLDLRQQITGASQGGGGFIIGPDGGYSGVNPAVFLDVINSNNMCVNFGTGPGGTAGMTINDSNNKGATFTGCYITNNVNVDGATAIDTTNNTGSTYSGNIVLTSAEAATRFTTYTQYGASNDYHLLAAATTLIGQGFDMSAFFTVDIGGTTRTAPWDCGPYIYVSGSSPANPTNFRRPRTLAGGGL